MGKHKTVERPRLKKILGKIGYREAARSTGIDHSKLWRWAHGQGLTHVDAAIALAKELKVSVETLFKKG